MKKYHTIRNLHFSGNYMILTVDGKKRKLVIRKISEALENAVLRVQVCNLNPIVSPQQKVN